MTIVGHGRPRALAGFEARHMMPWVSPDPRLVLAFWNPREFWGFIVLIYCFVLILIFCT
jgi:hypothetical protein